MVDPEQLWAHGGAKTSRSGVGEGRLSDWEVRQGVRLPAILRLGYAKQDGGRVRHTDIELHPLDEIRRADKDFWRFEEIAPEQARDQSLVFVLGEGASLGGEYLLNFNANGPGGEPSLYVFFNDGTGATLVGKNVEDYLREQLVVGSTPGIDWEASIESIEVLAREDFDLGFPGGGRVEQVLGRRDGGLVLLVRQLYRKKYEITSTFLPLPLNPTMATITPKRPAPKSTFALTLYPTEADEILHEGAKQLKDGRWKNTTMEGVPVYVDFEAAAKAPLERLRVLLFGDCDLPADPKPRTGGPTAYERLGALSPEDRRIASLLSGRKIKAEMEAKIAAAPDDETVPLSRLMIARAEEAIARAIAEGAPADPDQETILRVNTALQPDGS